MSRGYDDRERGYRDRDSPERGPPPHRGGRGGPPPRRREDDRSSLLVRNIPRDTRGEELRAAFERYGPIKDVYLPRDYYTREPRGFGFVQFLNPEDAEEAQYELDRTQFQGREITVVFAEESRKRPEDMRNRERHPPPPGPSYGRRRSPPGRYSSRSPDYSPSPPRRRSPSPRRRGRSPPPPPPGDDGFYGQGRPPRGDRDRPPPFYDDRGPPPNRGPPPRGPPRSGGPEGGGGSLVPPGYEGDAF